MMLPVHFLQALARDVRINLRRRQITVTQQHLHDPQIGASIQQVRRESVTQRVGRKLFLHAFAA